MSTIRLTVLGPFALMREQEAIPLKIGKLQALLTYLAVTRTAVAREYLLSLLWAESHPDAARKNLRNRLWQLRQTVGAEIIVANGDRLALAPTVWTDVAAFEEGVPALDHAPAVQAKPLAALLHLWRGRLLEDVYLSEAPDFEIWLTTERERLGQRYLNGLQALIAEHQRQADWSQVIAFAQTGLAYNPLQEPFHQAMMMAYAQQGARTAALRQYDQLRTLLAQDLAATPLPATEALRLAIVNNEWAPPGFSPLNGQSSPPMPHVAALPHPPMPAAAPFIGREAQLAALDLAWQQAARGQCKVVLISGELGIGKTRLWQTWAATRAPDQVILETRCLNTTQTLPFDPVRRLLGSPPGRTQFAVVASHLLPIWRAQLLQVAPTLAQGSSTGFPESVSSHFGGTGVLGEECHLTAEALTLFLRSFAAKPLIVFFDDLHWADEATLNWLLYLTDRMAGEPLLLVGAYRPEDAPALLSRLVGQWQREGILQRMPLPQLTKPEAAALLAQLGRNVTLAEDLHAQSGGNPYYLTQLDDATINEIPTTLADLVQARLLGLPAQLQPILQAAAVLEPAIDVEILRQTSGRTEEETLDALDGLLKAALLVERADLYEFAHPLVATVVRNELNSGRRKLLHRRAAEGLAARYAEHLAPVAGQLARHYAEAGVTNEAARFAEMAGEEALRIGASTAAAAFFEQAYSLSPQARYRLGMGRALLFLPGKLAEARTMMEEALAAFEAEGDYQGRLKAGLYLAGSYLSTSDGAQVIYWACRVLPDLETVEDATLHASAHYLMGTAKFRNGYSLTEAAAHYAEATRLATAQQPESEILLMGWFEWGNLALEAGAYADAVTKFQQARRVAQASQSVIFEVLSLNNLAYATLLTGALADARTWLAAGLALVETYALQQPQQYLYSTRGEIALSAGDLAAATADFEHALALAEKFDNPIFAANVRAHLGRVAQVRGDLDTAYTWLTTARAAVTGDKALYLQTQLDLWLTELHIQSGDKTSAEASLRLAEVRLAARQQQVLAQKAVRLRAFLDKEGMADDTE